MIGLSRTRKGILVGARHDEILHVEAAEIAFLSAAVDVARKRGDVPGAFVEHVHDGTATYVAPRWPVNKVLGLGLSGRVDPSAAVAEVDALWSRVQIPVELSDTVDPQLAASLEETGHHEVERETVSVLDPRVARLQGPPRVASELVTSKTEATWLETSVGGFAVPADGPAHAEFPSDVLGQVFGDRLRIGRTTCWLARVDGEVAGAAAMHVEGDVGLLCGATTLPAFRRRGVQTALLVARITAARERGCRVVVVTTPEGSASEKSVRAAGFGVLHTRRLLERMR